MVLYCTLLQCVAERVAVCCSEMQSVAACCNVLTFVAMCCNALQCVLKCVAGLVAVTFFCVMQCDAA